MKNITRDELKALAESLYFELDEKQIEELQNEFTSLFEEFDNLHKLDTDHVKASSWEKINPESVLREDIPNSFDADETIKNAPIKNGRFVEVK